LVLLVIENIVGRNPPEEDFFGAAGIIIIEMN
jgi:hypothetical protein